MFLAINSLFAEANGLFKRIIRVLIKIEQCGQ